MRGNGFKLQEDRVGWDIQKKFFPLKLWLPHQGSLEQPGPVECRGVKWDGSESFQPKPSCNSTFLRNQGLMVSFGPGGDVKTLGGAGQAAVIPGFVQDPHSCCVFQHIAVSCMCESIQVPPCPWRVGTLPHLSHKITFTLQNNIYLLPTQVGYQIFV